VRATLLDEGLAVLDGLWSGEPFTFEGEHFQVQDALCWPRPVQAPRIPVWVAGAWPNRRPMRRAARWDGVFPLKLDPDGFARLTPDEVREIRAYIEGHRESAAPFDVVIGGVTPATDRKGAVEIVAPYEAAGLTWWHECAPEFDTPLAVMRNRIRQGPPRPLSSPRIINVP
jgi:alkanesulfonate monooxygenase SsuD/methylene tetrahydromethanopterin reductase-like flavin-dependent oxidoreductase (luciferase family)